MSALYRQESLTPATESVKRTLRRGQAIILESTTYPGTTREILLPALESTGLKVGVDFFLAFSPERVDPGNPVYGTRNTPKVVGGITLDCRRVAVALYQPAIDTLVPVSTTEAWMSSAEIRASSLARFFGIGPASTRA